MGFPGADSASIAPKTMGDIGPNDLIPQATCSEVCSPAKINVGAWKTVREYVCYVRAGR